MPVSNIADVTTAIIAKIRQGLTDSGMWATLPAIYPDSISREEKAGISFYLYHLRENAHYKNASPPGRDLPPIKLIPLGLDLYYQLTALGQELTDGEAAYEEQRMMTVVLKTLHDAPIFALGDDRFRISLQPVPASDAVHNWTAGSSPMKLSAYYEVSPVLIEPDPPTLYSGRVLRYGNYVFGSGAPRITASQSIVEFRLPGEATNRQITAQPAQAAPDTVVTFICSGLDGGTIMLRIFNSRWDENVITPGWQLTVATGQLTAKVQTTANFENGGAVTAVLPGMYTAQVVVTKTLQLPDGSTKEFEQGSNQFPFIVMPIANPGSFTGTKMLVAGYGFQMAVPQDEMEVYIGETRLVRSAGAVTNAGEFRVITTQQFELNLPAAMTPNQDLPLRVLVAGAESSPVWIHIP